MKLAFGFLIGVILAISAWFWYWMLRDGMASSGRDGGWRDAEPVVTA